MNNEKSKNLGLIIAIIITALASLVCNLDGSYKVGLYISIVQLIVGILLLFFLVLIKKK